LERIERRVREKLAGHCPSENCVLGVRISMLSHISASGKYYVPSINERDVHDLFSKFGKVLKVVTFPPGINGGLCFVHMQRYLDAFFAQKVINAKMSENKLLDGKL